MPVFYHELRGKATIISFNRADTPSPPDSPPDRSRIPFHRPYHSHQQPFKRDQAPIFKKLRRQKTWSSAKQRINVRTLSVASRACFRLFSPPVVTFFNLLQDLGTPIFGRERNLLSQPRSPRLGGRRSSNGCIPATRGQVRRSGR